MQLRRIWDGATLLVQLNAGHSWIDVREILTRLSPRFPEDKLANWSSNLVDSCRPRWRCARAPSPYHSMPIVRTYEALTGSDSPNCPWRAIGV